MSKQKELHDNELAVWLNKINTSIEPYSKLIAVVVFALIVGAIAWGLYSSKVSGDRSDATLQLLMADPEVAEKYPETAAAGWSILYSANRDLEAGIQSLYADRSDAETLLTQAKSSFREALAASDDRLLRSRAFLGLALAAESMGEIDEAIAAYNDTISVNESKAMVQKAQKRIDELSSPETKDFVAWFAEQDFRPADPSLPPELPSGTTLPDLPDLKLPTLGSGDDTDEDDEMSLDDMPGLELPADYDVATPEATPEK
ncbi:MAG: tetratricopeptide repeat protein, partial [Pirellulaceae bacterium]|nr:tetratricopeptide repeat protein [Pirellulaceae bacterium]